MIIGVLCDFTFWAPEGALRPDAAEHAAAINARAAAGDTIILISNRLNSIGRLRSFIGDITDIGVSYHDYWTGDGFPGLDEVYIGQQKERSAVSGSGVGAGEAEVTGPERAPDQRGTEDAGDHAVPRRRKQQDKSGRG